MTTPKLSLSRMEEYCAKASEGPWFADGDYVVDTFDFHPKDAPDEAIAIVQFGKLKNSHFIANARSDFPALLSWAKRARASLLFVEENCVNANEHCEECEEIEQLLSECGE